MKNIENLHDNLESIFSTILKKEKDERIKRLEEIKNNPEIKNIYELLKKREFSKVYNEISAYHKNIETIIEELYDDNQELAFLLTNQQFIKTHLSNVFQTYEGSSYSTDKERTVFSFLINSLIENTEIKFNYNAQYIYNLPKKILNDHESIMAFFKALHHLFYGNNKLYLEQINKFNQTIK